MAKNKQNNRALDPPIQFEEDITTMTSLSTTSPSIVITPTIRIEPGLETLASMDYMFIKQNLEIAEMVTGVSTRNSYEIQDHYKQKIFTAHETTGDCAFCCGTRFCCASARPFKIIIFDSFGNPVLKVKRPCSCLLCCTNIPILCCVLGQIGGGVKVTTGEDELIGEVVHSFNCYRPALKVKDLSGHHSLTIRGPCCGDCYCRRSAQCCCNQNVAYSIKKAETGAEVGNIQKQYAGFTQESASNASNFVLEFPFTLSINTKALLLASVFLVDFLYFESKSSKKVKKVPIERPH